MEQIESNRKKRLDERRRHFAKVCTQATQKLIQFLSLSMYSMCLTHFSNRVPALFSPFLLHFFSQGKTTFIHSHGVCNGMHKHTVLSFALTKDLFISFSLVFFFLNRVFFSGDAHAFL